MSIMKLICITTYRPIAQLRALNTKRRHIEHTVQSEQNKCFLIFNVIKWNIHINEMRTRLVSCNTNTNSNRQGAFAYNIKRRHTFTSTDCVGSDPPRSYYDISHFHVT